MRMKGRFCRKGSRCNGLPRSAETEFDFAHHLDSRLIYEYLELATNDELPIDALAQLFRDRANCEKVFDEIKNQ